MLLSCKGNATDNASTTDPTTAENNGMAIAIILGGLMGFLLLILATVTIGTCVICICLRVCKSRRKSKKTGERPIHTVPMYMIDQCKCVLKYNNIIICYCIILTCTYQCFSFSIVLYIIVLHILQFYYSNSTDAKSDIYDTAHSVILEQNPAYASVPVHQKPTDNEYQEIRRGYPPSLAQGHVYA